MFRETEKNISFAELEKQVLMYWKENQCFEKSVANPGKNGEFIFFDGPPFATGLPHYGHLLAGTIKDIVPRYWTMKGYRVQRRFGWDCHGLPIESLIQNELKLSGNKEIEDYGIGNFNEACRASVLKYTSEWEVTVNKMGRWIDFENNYKTMNPDFMESVWWVFAECFKKGLIYQGYRIQPYSPALGTPLSNFETNQGYKDRQDPSITVEMPLVGSEESILVWTTTPWTLPSNMAVAVGSVIPYVLVEFEGKKYWVAENRKVAIFKDKGVEVAKILGKELAGRKYQPLFNYQTIQSPKQYTLLLADFVSTEDGTGVVHIAPSFGEDDFQLGLREGLGLFDPLDEQARFTDTVPEWKGVGAKDADKSIIQAIKSLGRLFNQTTLMHSYPHCYRTDVPLIYRALKTWFLKLDAEITSAEGETKTLKQWMIDCNQQINWIPEHVKNGRFGKWLEGARDWNLSRNRYWGTPIPIWCAEDGDMICIGSRAELEALSGKKVDDLHKHLVDTCDLYTSDKKTFDPKGKRYIRTPEVLDCWFESGAMPYAQNHYPFQNKQQFEGAFPADFIAEGLDQTRGWFYTLTVLSAALFQKPAFKNVIINGIILTENGQKMSKRLKNYPDPNDLIDRVSADAIRLYMINSQAVKAGDLKFSEAGVREMVRSILLPLWNALSLFTTYANADESKGQLTWKPGNDLKSNHQLDRWILSALQKLLTHIQAEMEAFRLYNVVPAVVTFIDDLTNWYIRRSRRRFWKSENDQDKNEAYATLYRVLVDFSKVLAPILPFLAETIYQILVREIIKEAPVSVHLNDFPEPDTTLADENLVNQMSLVREAVNLGRTLRANANIKNRQPLAGLKVAVAGELESQQIQELESLIREELNVKLVTVTTKESELVTYQAKANFKTLGKKLGGKMKEVAALIGELTHDDIAGLLKGQSVIVGGFDITAEDIVVVRQIEEGLAVEAGLRCTVALDTKLNGELIQEGVAKECINRIQNLRKESGLQVTDTISLHVNTTSEFLKESFLKNKSTICSEVLASEVVWSEGSGDFSAEVDYESEIISFKIVKEI